MDQREDLKLPYLHCHGRNICEIWRVETRIIKKRMYSLVNVENYQNMEYTENNI